MNPQQDIAFFIVWNPQGGNPKQRHGSPYLAIEEAKRLARLSPGQKFYVARVSGVAEVEPAPTTFHVLASS